MACRLSGFDPGPGMLYVRRKNLALNFRDGLSMCLAEETLTYVEPFYLVIMPVEGKISHTGGKYVTCRGLHILA